MSTHKELMGEQRKKHDALTAAGVNPYSTTSATTHTNSAVLANFVTLFAHATQLSIVGRVVAIRLYGAFLFLFVLLPCT